MSYPPDRRTQAMKDADKRAEGYFFPDGEPVGDWVVICTNPECGICGRNPEFLTCPVCGSSRMATVDYIDGLKAQEVSGK